MRSTRRLAVGATGHRYLAEVPKLRGAIDSALDRLQEAFPNCSLSVVSSLAEGADRLIAQAVLRRRGGDLVVPLPLEAGEYVKDFGSPESRAEFRELLTRASEIVTFPRAPTRAEAYAQAGDYVLEHSDALIALWDGREAQGRGGTANVVGKALRRGMPVLHIKAGNRLPGTTTPTTLGPDQGALIVHNLVGSRPAEAR